MTMYYITHTLFIVSQLICCVMTKYYISYTLFIVSELICCVSYLLCQLHVRTVNFM